MKKELEEQRIYHTYFNDHHYEIVKPMINNIIALDLCDNLSSLIKQY